MPIGGIEPLRIPSKRYNHTAKETNHQPPTHFDVHPWNEMKSNQSCGILEVPEGFPKSRKEFPDVHQELRGPSRNLQNPTQMLSYDYEDKPTPSTDKQWCFHPLNFHMLEFFRAARTVSYIVGWDSCEHMTWLWYAHAHTPPSIHNAPVTWRILFLKGSFQTCVTLDLTYIIHVTSQTILTNCCLAHTTFFFVCFYRMISWKHQLPNFGNFYMTWKSSSSSRHPIKIIQKIFAQLHKKCTHFPWNLLVI